MRVSVPLPLSLTLPVQESPLSSASTESTLQKTSSQQTTSQGVGAAQGQGLVQGPAPGQGLSQPIESTVALWSCFEVAMARCQPLSPDSIDDNTPVRRHPASPTTQPELHAQKEVVVEEESINPRTHPGTSVRRSGDDRVPQLAADGNTDSSSSGGDGGSHPGGSISDNLSAACFLSEMLPLLRDADKEKEKAKEKENEPPHGRGSGQAVADSLPTTSSTTTTTTTTQASVPLTVTERDLSLAPLLCNDDDVLSAPALSSLTPVWMGSSTPTSPPPAKAYSSSTGAALAPANPSPATLAARALASSTSTTQRSRTRRRTPMASAEMAPTHKEDAGVDGDAGADANISRMQPQSQAHLRQQEDDQQQDQRQDNGDNNNRVRDQCLDGPAGRKGGEGSDSVDQRKSAPPQSSGRETSGDDEQSMNLSSSSNNNVLDEWQPDIGDSSQGRTLFLRTRDGRLITISTTRPVPRRVADVRALVDSFFKSPGGRGNGSVPGSTTSTVSAAMSTPSTHLISTPSTVELDVNDNDKK